MSHNIDNLIFTVQRPPKQWMGLLWRFTHLVTILWNPLNQLQLASVGVFWSESFKSSNVVILHDFLDQINGLSKFI